MIKEDEFGHYLSEHLSKIKNITVPKELPKHYQVYQMYTIQLNDKVTRDTFQNYLAEKGIMNKVYFNPVHLKTIYTRQYKYKKGDLPQTEALSNRVLNIPLYPTITKEELDYIIKTIQEFFKNKKVA